MAERAGDRIIDRDVEFYEMELDYCADRLRRCTPQHEPYWIERAGKARKVAEALRAYRDKINEQESLT